MAVLLTAKPLFADIYKCVSEDGVATFSDEPCGTNAAVSFHQLGIDELIVLVSPYAQPIIDLNRIENDLLALSRRIGDCILPHERYYGHNVRIEKDRPFFWEVRLWYAPENYTEWEIRMEYEKIKKHNDTSVWLKTISITRWGKPYNPPAMQDVKKINKKRTGEWVTDQ
ncbi:MAG: DUF4124 domain-containing protein [Proteobacteria bacterium]|nr:DUF4124 domain-containing protein [Pseudomonadota bacterium]MBU1582944.1 DUF4124 domain-containing protein [Pseudomonadota bacterium]MBU2451755.1 DUF4124 domain-containing protein [Pseudomonadota bacterium]MBU2629427.1 DUF4124 domain-containing protein [Pseudomonadota bacterium]